MFSCNDGPVRTITSHAARRSRTTVAIYDVSGIQNSRARGSLVSPSTFGPRCFARHTLAVDEGGLCRPFFAEGRNGHQQAVVSAQGRGSACGAKGSIVWFFQRCVMYEWRKPPPAWGTPSYGG